MTWGGWDKNPYYNPENCGLTLVVALEVPNLSYEFDSIIVVRHDSTGKFYAAWDAGCSCPTPFENFTGVDDMTEIKSLNEYVDFCKSHNHSWSYYNFDKADIKAGKRALKDLGLPKGDK